MKRNEWLASLKVVINMSIPFKIKIFFAWYDFWVGVFYDRKKQTLYVCPVPTLVISISKRKPEPSTPCPISHCKSCSSILVPVYKVCKKDKFGLTYRRCTHCNIDYRFLGQTLIDQVPHYKKSQVRKNSNSI